MKNIYHVSGTHCASCKILLEDIISEQDFVESVNVNLKKEIVEIESEYNSEDVLNILNSKIKDNGYVLSLEKQNKEKQNHKDLLIALPIGIIFLILFFILQKSSVLNFGIGGEITPTTSFIIGLIASVSSCLAIVGGLVLSLSAKISQDNVSDKKNIILFHFGRLFSFAILGGVLGLVGSAIGINFTFTSILGIIASVIMLLLGLNLVGLFTKNKFTLHSGIFKNINYFFNKIEHKTFTPIIIGFSTFFLPCGFTQSMQFSALSSGSFLSGMMIMFFFALGTLPILAVLSFSSVSFSHSKYGPIFFKSAGIVVVGFGLFALLSGLVALGVINPIFNL